MVKSRMFTNNRRKKNNIVNAFNYPTTFDLLRNSLCSSKETVGSLVDSRRAHGAVFDGDKFLLIGGRKNDDFEPVVTEVCTLKDSTMTCVEQSEALDQYAYYPELFIVSQNFGKDFNKC